MNVHDDELLRPFTSNTMFDDLLLEAAPSTKQPVEVLGWRMRNYPRVQRQAQVLCQAFKLGIPTYFGQLRLKVIKPWGEEIDYGLASLRVVTTVGVGFIVDAFQNIVELEIMKYHGIGTGTTAEAAADTALVTEITTQYNPDSTRATGTTIEGGSGNVYRTVATNTVDGSVAATEHGIFSQAATGGGVLLDRSVFSVINLASGDGLASTYDLTFASGG